MTQQPLLRRDMLTGQPVVLIRYKQHDNGTIRAIDKRTLDRRDVLNFIDDLGISTPAFDEIARALGFELTAEQVHSEGE